MEDADLMLEWKNYPETRNFAIVTNEIIKREDHIKYLKNNLKYFQIIQVEGEIVGAIRIEDNELAVWIDREFWNYGFATQVIKLISKVGMTAKIVDSNINSMRAFINAKYKPVKFVKGDQTNYYIFKL